MIVYGRDWIKLMNHQNFDQSATFGGNIKFSKRTIGAFFSRRSSKRNSLFLRNKKTCFNTIWQRLRYFFNHIEWYHGNARTYILYLLLLKLLFIGNSHLIGHFRGNLLQNVTQINICLLWFSTILNSVHEIGYLFQEALCEYFVY